MEFNKTSYQGFNHSPIRNKKIQSCLWSFYHFTSRW